LIVPLGTQIVLRPDLHPACGIPFDVQGVVAEIVALPERHEGSYTVRTVENALVSLPRKAFSILKQSQLGPLLESRNVNSDDLDRFIVYRCIVGSQAYGLSRDGSDVDRRGVYVPPADLEWSIYSLPEQIERRESEECYWEIKKFLILALKSNPNILECLFSPLIEYSDEIGDVLCSKRSIFLSKLAYQTYNGYVMSQFKKLEQDVRNQGEIKWKHAMHLIRLLLQGISLLEEGTLPVLVEEHRDTLLGIRDGHLQWDEVNAWRLDLHKRFDRASSITALPDYPDYDAADELLKWIRRRMVRQS
jgi:predicted nucleotidyltransferase